MVSLLSHKIREAVAGPTARSPRRKLLWGDAQHGLTILGGDLRLLAGRTVIVTLDGEALHTTVEQMECARSLSHGCVGHHGRLITVCHRPGQSRRHFLLVTIIVTLVIIAPNRGAVRRGRVKARTLEAGVSRQRNRALRTESST